MSASVTFAAVVLAGVGACYSGPINMAPRITIMAITPLERGAVATFAADVTDPDNDPVRVEWTHAPMRCTAEPPPQAVRMTGPRYTVAAPDTDGVFCVWATARDRYEATTAAAPLEVNPDNDAPDVVLNAALEFPETWFPPPTFPLYRSIRLDASNSSDPEDDELSYQWDLVGGPDVAALTLHDCTDGASTSVRCLTPKLPGAYKVRVTARDTHGGVSDATETLTVNPDQPPCLESTDPVRTAWMVSTRPDQLRTIRIETVVDDGNPYPRRSEPGLEDPKFRWSVGPKSGPLQLLTDEKAYYDLPAFSHNVGDEVKVRVEVFDRNKPEIEDRLFTCGDNDVCGVDGCIQRMTWLVSYGE